MAGCLSASVNAVRPIRLITVPTLRLGKEIEKRMDKLTDKHKETMEDAFIALFKAIYLMGKTDLEYDADNSNFKNEKDFRIEWTHNQIVKLSSLTLATYKKIDKLKTDKMDFLL